MRFKKGSKVEVLRQKSSGAWYCAQIISGNGHKYNVRYENISTINGETVVERISRKAVRPRPPKSMDNLVTGDLAEALISGAWKEAVILKVLCGDCYLVRLVGFLEEFRMHKSNIRLRQSWQDGKWFVTGKEKAGLELSNFGSSRKRSPSSCSSHIGTYPIKMRCVVKEGKNEQVISGSSFPLSDKVDADDLLREKLGVKYLKFSFNNETADYCEIEKGDTYGGIFCVPKRRRKANEDDSDICSVGSCSVVNNSSDPRWHGHNLAGPCVDTDALYSEAEYSHGCGNKEESYYVPSNENERERIHRLELLAYRSTLVALHASGPLSWEQEALLTNLRISLHISHDEYWAKVGGLHALLLLV